MSNTERGVQMRLHEQKLPATAGSVRRASRQQRSEDPGVSVQPVRGPGSWTFWLCCDFFRQCCAGEIVS